MPEGVVGAPGGRPSAHVVLPEPGETIGGKYKVVRRLGEGGMAVVFEAMHLRLRQPIAMKVLRPDVADSHALLARFEREARATAQLRSVNAARVIDVDVLPGGLPFMVMELLEGNDLDVELQNTGAMIVVRAADIVLQTAAAMQEAHSLGIVHRDLKPANLFLCPMADRVVVKVLDFGISKMEDDGARITQSNAYFGTPAYCAPEQLRDAAAADARCDVWSLGVILYELLTGHLPFEGSPTAVIAKVLTDPIPSPLELRPDLPPDLVRIVLRALERDPAKRFQTMQEIAEALRPFGPARAAAAVLAEQQRGRGKLGEILVNEGLLTAADLQKALDEQRRTGKLLGKLLIEMELVSHADLLTALAKQQGIHPAGPSGGAAPAPAQAAREPQGEKRAMGIPTAPPSSPLRSAGIKSASTEEPSGTRRWIVLAVALGIPVGILVGLWAAGFIGR
jgi:serine/threonine protein kinase